MCQVLQLVKLELKCDSSGSHVKTLRNFSVVCVGLEVLRKIAATFLIALTTAACLAKIHERAALLCKPNGSKCGKKVAAYSMENMVHACTFHCTHCFRTKQQ